MAGLFMRALRAFFEPPDPGAEEFVRENELLAARVRLVTIAALIPIPLKSIFINPANVDNWIGVALGGVALLAALGYLLLARRPRPPRSLGLVGTLLDVSLVTAGFVGFLAAGHPLTATNSFIQYTIYFLALAATCLRHDPRLCLLGGLVAFVEYGAVVGWVGWGLGGAALPPDPEYGRFSWDSQVGRLILLIIVSFVNAAIVVRTRTHWREAIRDRLTGLFNRAFFEEQLTLAIADARRAERPLVVAIADLDHFKSLNDRHGHAAGDAALVRFAALWRDSFRPGDAPARYGGEEFVVMLAGAGVEAARARLAALRAALAREPVKLPGGKSESLTASAGIAIYPADGATPRALLERADARLYEAKRAGRDRVVG